MVPSELTWVKELQSILNQSVLSYQMYAICQACSQVMMSVMNVEPGQVSVIL